MNNDDERDYDEEQYNRHLLDDDTDPDEDLPVPPAYTRSGHRAAAANLAGMAERSDPEFAPGLGFAALTHAVLALSAPEPEEGAWRQRAVEAEATLTTIGGIIARDSKHVPPKWLVARIGHILRESGRQEPPA